MIYDISLVHTKDMTTHRDSTTITRRYRTNTSILCKVTPRRHQAAAPTDRKAYCALPVAPTDNLIHGLGHCSLTGDEDITSAMSSQAELREQVEGCNWALLRIFLLRIERFFVLRTKNVRYESFLSLVVRCALLLPKPW